MLVGAVSCKCSRNIILYNIINQLLPKITLIFDINIMIYQNTVFRGKTMHIIPVFPKRGRIMNIKVVSVFDLLNEVIRGYFKCFYAWLQSGTSIFVFRVPSTSIFLSKFTGGFTKGKSKISMFWQVFPEIVLFPLKSCCGCKIFLKNFCLSLNAPHRRFGGLGPPPGALKQIAKAWVQTPKLLRDLLKEIRRFRRFGKFPRNHAVPSPILLGLAIIVKRAIMFRKQNFNELSVNNQVLSINYVPI